MKKYIVILVLFAAVQFYCSAQNKGFPSASLPLENLDAFTTGANWKIAGDVFFDYRPTGKTSIAAGTGIVVNQVTDKNKDHLVSKMEHGDIELELDFMMDKNSNAGVYLQGRYEVQMFDSWGVKTPKSSDCGAIYERWDESRPEGRKGYEGHPPSQNVSKAPGLWQHYRIVFRAPRFNASGEKTENARFISVEQNGVIIHENVEVTGPTRAALFQDEKPLGPLVIQGDHGPVAIRNINYKAYGNDAVSLTDLKLAAFEGRFKAPSDFQTLTPKKEMAIELLEHQGTESKDNYGGRITGNIHLPKSGKYFLLLNLKWIPGDTNPDRPNGGGELTIGNNTVLSLDGKHGGIVSVIIELEAGTYPFKLSYYKTYQLWYAQSNDIVLSVEAPGIPFRNLNAVLKSAEAVGAITLPVTNEPVMQRSFINHGGKKKTHVMSVGEPGAVNYTIDLSSGSFLQFWRGDFIETTLMWYGRGEPQLAQPLGSVIERLGQPSIAFLQDKNSVWPDSSAGFNYLGYDVNKSGRPVFKYVIENAEIRDLFESGDDGKKLSHTLTIANLTRDAWCKVAEGTDVVKQPNGLYAIGNKQYFIQLPDKSDPLIRKTSRNTVELLLPVRKGNSGEVKYSIIW
jgi:Domain of Unknown Function (DUF1080)